MKFLVLLAIAAGVLCGADSIKVFGRDWTVYLGGDWQVTQDSGAETLRLANGREPLPGPRRPFQFALTDVPNYATLTLEADVKPLGRSIMIVFAYRDADHFNYAHFSTDEASKQPVHNGVFHVYGGERVRISGESGPPSFAATGKWYHVKIVHNAETGALTGYVDGKPVPSLHAVDLSLGPGKTGIGSFNETGEFKNVRITTAGTAPAR